MAGKKLLVADDSLTIQKVIRLALSNEGYDIQAVSDGNEAIQQLSLFRPDVVLIDVSLPGKTAFEVKRAINEQGDLNSCSFILMSSAFEKVDEEQADEVVFQARLTKPFDPAHLRQVLTEALELNAEPAFGSAPDADQGSDLLEPMKPMDLPFPPMPSGSEAAVVLEDEFLENSNSWESKEASSEVDTFAQITPPPLPGSRFGTSETITPPSAPIRIPEFELSDDQSSGTDSDIQQLTDSTMRRNELGDMQWSISESAKKPASASAVGEATLTHLQAKESLIRPPHDMSDVGGSNFHLDPPNQSSTDYSAAGAYHNAPIELEDRPATLAPPPIPFGGSTLGQNPDVLPLSTGQMEEIIQKQLQATLEKMAEKMLPELAERIIKQEIRRMLQEQP